MQEQEENKKQRKGIGGRKKLLDSERKSVEKTICFTPVQYEAIEKKRKSTKYKDFSSYVSFLVTSKSEKLQLTSSLDTKGLQELRKMNSLINQIARTINTNKDNLDPVKTHQSLSLIYEYLRNIEREIQSKLL